MGRPPCDGDLAGGLRQVQRVDAGEELAADREGPLDFHLDLVDSGTGSVEVIGALMMMFVPSWTAVVQVPRPLP